MENFKEQVKFLSEQLSLHGLDFSSEDIEETLNILESITLKLIITNVPREVYDHEIAKRAFEDVFKAFDAKSTFVYLPSFRRAQVYMTEPAAALCARMQTDGWTLPPTIVDLLSTQSFTAPPHTGIHCFIDQVDADIHEADTSEECTCGFGEARTAVSDELPNSASARVEPPNQSSKSPGITTLESENASEASGDDTVGVPACPRHGRMKHLALPKPPRLFLLSPPSSPPVGWEPKPESEPIINYQLLEALASLAPGEPFELHPSNTDQRHPSIVITPCDDTCRVSDAPRSAIVHTPCPQRSPPTSQSTSTPKNS